MKTPSIKLSSPATEEFWEIPVLWEDADLLALDKPAGLATVPDPLHPARPDLMELLHAGIAAGKPWAIQRDLSHLGNPHRLDTESSGLLLLAKSKTAQAALADLFGIQKPLVKYQVLVRGIPDQLSFEIEAPIAPHPVTEGRMHVDLQAGKQSTTRFEVLETFPLHDFAWLQCEPITQRPHQIRVHLRHAGLTVVGDTLYGGKPLWLSRLKRDYRLKPGREERPLIHRAALHASELTLPHPVTQASLHLQCELPKDLKVGLKYLRLYGTTPAL